MSFESLLRAHPIVVSVQAAPDSPLCSPPLLLSLARASLANGAAVLRLEGVEAIRVIREATGAPTIGLIKRDFPDSPVYITPTLREVEELVATGCEAIALDATRRPRPGGERFDLLANRIRQGGALVFADCDTPDSVRHALEGGADLVSTTLAGYTNDSPRMVGPDLEFLRRAVRLSDVPVLAEGRYVERSQVQAALRIGAVAVVMGGAVNDPVKQTRMFAEAVARPEGKVGAVDIGGTWLRFAEFDAAGRKLRTERVPLPRTRAARLAWIRARAAGVRRLGVSTGGTVDPSTGRVVESKPTIPQNVGAEYSLVTLGVPTRALNDGLASAWGHACHPRFAGLRVATLAIGTGVGCGLVTGQRLHMGRQGDYPRLNDLPFEGGTVEDALGGGSGGLFQDPARARRAAEFVLQTACATWQPEVVVLCGAVGLALADQVRVHGVKLVRSPYGEDAGLFGAAALALYPPDFA